MGREKAQARGAGPPEPVARARGRPRLGILLTPGDRFAASSDASMEAFSAAAAEAGLDVVRLGRADLDRVAALDGLLIRDLTSPLNHTRAFAAQAERRGIPVIDSSRSIDLCCDKLRMSAAFAAHGVATPPTRVLDDPARIDAVIAALGLPLVLKLPNSAFSRGVWLAPDRDAVRRLAAAAGPTPLLAQAFTPTPFDWRVGVLAGKPVYVCKYFMAPGHWQIIDASAAGEIDGDLEALSLRDAPPALLAAAIRAAAAIGDGLYGVDVKEVDGAFLTIEVNDNPTIEEGQETAGGDNPWHALAGWFAARMRARAAGVG